MAKAGILVQPLAFGTLLFTNVLLSFDFLPVCLINNIAAFLPLDGFVELICSSRSLNECNFLPSTICLSIPSSITPFINWYHGQRMRASIRPLLSFACAPDLNTDLTSLFRLRCLCSVDLNLLLCSEKCTDDFLAQLLCDRSIGNQETDVDSGIIPVTCLDLSYCPRLTDLSLEIIGRLSQLCSLEMFKCDNISDNGLVHLAALPLTYLDLSFCGGISDAGLLHLLALPLNLLNLSACFDITEDGRALLRTTFPTATLRL